MNKEMITIHGAMVFFIGVLKVVSQQVDDGNYIVPIATLDLGHHSNKSAAGHKKRCETNADCEGFVNNQCCRTISGFQKCRKKCKQPKLSSTFRTRRGRNKYRLRMVSVLPEKVCNVGGKIYKEGQKLATKDGCKKCVCSKGSVLCTNLMCFADQKLCNVDDKIYHEGQKIEVNDDCNKCVCTKGTILCKERQCPPAKCEYKEKFYDDGYHLILGNGCKECICQKKSWECTSRPCGDFNIRNSVMNVVPSIFIPVFSCFLSIYTSLFS